MRLSEVMIFVHDLPRMTAFYETTLGLKPIRETRTDAWVEFDAGGCRFALHAIPASIASTVKPREMNPVKLIFEVKDMAAESARLAALGVTIIRRAWGTCDWVDPEGNIFGITSTTSPPPL